MIEVKNLNKNFGNIRALDDFSFHFERSKITVLSGADGSGKSTLFKLILGLTKLDSGEIILKDEPLSTDFSRVTEIAGYMPEKFSLYPDLTVEENLNFFSDIHGVEFKRREEMKKMLLERTGMIKFRNRRAGALSGGMKQKLSLSSILLSSPEVLLLDEPTTGVDPLSRIEFFNIIELLKSEGKTIIISTPYLEEAEKGDNIVFINKGKIRKSGNISELKKNVPFKLFSLIPERNIFEILEELKKEKRLEGKVFMKGKYIKFISKDDDDLLSLIPGKQIREESPGLEDIYLYYERIANTGGPDG
ncbi:MAG: ABC transporter ATP-binding protein [Acidobacteriota bacterium]